MRIRSNLSNFLNKKLKPEHFFIIISLFFGTIYSIITPPFRAPDEVRHYMRLYDISTGNIFGNMSETPDSVIRFIHSTRADCPRTLTKWYIECLGQKKDISPHSQTYQIPVWFASAYTPISYLPAIPVMVLGNIFKIPLLFTFFSARFALMIASSLLIFYGIKRLPYWQWQTSFFFLFTSQIFIRSNISADGITAGIALLVISESIRNKENLGTASRFFLSSLLSITKYAYTPICACLVQNERKMLKAIFFVVMPIFLSTFCALLMPDIMQDSYSAEKTILEKYPDFYNKHITFFNDFYMDGNKIFNRTNNTNQETVSISPKDQIIFLIKSPEQILFIGTKTIKLYFNFWISNMTNIIGKSRDIVTFPLPIIYILLLFMLKNDRTSTVRKTENIRNTIIFFVIFCGIAAGLYVSYNTVGSSFVVGFQGRYFVPIIPLLLVLVPATRKPTENQNSSNRIACFGLLISLLCALTTYLHLEYNLYSSFLTSRVAPGFI